MSESQLTDEEITVNYRKKLEELDNKTLQKKFG